MAEKIRLKGQLKLPVVGKNPTFAQMKFVKVALSEPDILPDSGSIFTCDEQGNYDFEIYTGAHLLSYNVGNSWSKPVEIIAEPLVDGLESIEISDLIGFQEIPELDATIAALNQQKQELLLIQQGVQNDKYTATAAAASATSSANEAKLALSMDVMFYVNPDFVGESDGSSSKPFLTIKEAIESCPVRHLTVMCAAGKTHIINSRIDGMHLLSLSIFSDSPPAKADLRCSHTESGGLMTVGGVLVRSSVMIGMYHVSLIIDDYVDTSSALALYSSAAISTTDLSLAALVVLDSTSITYSGIALIAAGSAIRSSKADVLIADSQINRQSSIRSNAKLFETQTGSISAANLALSGVTSSQLVQNIANWQSNIVWS